jgi:predicted phage-related endonuclease
MRNKSVIHSVGLIANVDKPWHQTSLDRVVDECPLDRRIKSRCALEIKTRNAFGSRRWHVELPDDILAQIAHQLFVSGFEHLHYGVLIGGNEYRQGVVRAANEADTIVYVIDLADRFRATYLREGAEVEPPWDLDLAPQSVIDLDAARYPDRVGDIDVHDIGDVITLADLRARKNVLGREEKAAVAQLRRHAHGARFLLFGGEPAAEFVPRSKIHIHTDVLAEKYPDVWNDPEVVEFRTYYQLELAPAYKTRTENSSP